MTAVQPKVHRRTIFAAGKTAQHCAIAMPIQTADAVHKLCKTIKTAASYGPGRRREIFLYCDLIDAAVSICKVCGSCRLNCRVSVVLVSG